MKYLIAILIASFLGLNTWAQKDHVDSLILNINNDQLHGTCHYVWVIEMKSTYGDSLIKIGKSITPKLVPLLIDKEKGIIVHYILSNIWMDTVKFSSNFHLPTIEYNYCGLIFYEKNEHIFTKDSFLNENKKKWIEIINKSSR